MQVHRVWYDLGGLEADCMTVRSLLPSLKVRKAEQEELLAEWGITPVKTISRRDTIISYITPQDMLKVVDLYVEQEVRVNALLITYDEVWIVCDWGCDCFLEDFTHEAIAIRWLVGDYPSVEYLYKLDAKPCSP